LFEIESETNAFTPRPTIQSLVVENPETPFVVVGQWIFVEAKSASNASVKFGAVFLDELFEGHG
jgi:hypothetical protein